MKIKLLISSFVCSIVFSTGNIILAQNFTKITEGPMVNDGAQSAGCAWGDFDNDGDDDLFVTNGIMSGAKNLLFINNGPGSNYTFTQVTEGNIVNDAAPSRAASFGDYNNDGNLDLFVANQMGNNYNYLYQNNGDRTFTKITEGSVVSDWDESEAAGWFDYDRDGFLDLFVGNPVAPNALYHGNGDGNFTRIQDGPLATDNGTGSFDWCDFDEDGDFDILVGYWGSNLGALFINDGSENFSKIEAGMVLNDPEAGLRAGDWVDYDNDGDWDIVNIDEGIYINEGSDSNYHFTLEDNSVIEAGNNKWSISSWSDLDNDGDIDLFVTNTIGYNFLYSNNGDGSFTKITEGDITKEFAASVGSAWADYDKDGDMDVYVCNREENNSLYNNACSNGNGWVKINLHGRTSNRAAIGSTIKVKANTGVAPIWQMRAIEGQTSTMGQNSLTAHFGLGTASVIDSLVVLWPSGEVTTGTNLEANKLYNITEGWSVGIDMYVLNNTDVRVYPNPAVDEVNIDLNQQIYQPVTIDLIDITGKLCARKLNAQGSGIIKFNISELANGAYILKIYSNRTPVIEKFVKY
jgi:enediyne biosynthesis protein E4